LGAVDSKKSLRLNSLMEPLSFAKHPFTEGQSMVDKLQRKGEVVYLCELCGFGYKALETAELCEEYCGMNGNYSPDIHKHAICKPAVPVM
jgi:hypothetical protein